MNAAIWIFLGGAVIAVGSILLKRRENRLFENAVQAQATVTRYDEYQETGSSSSSVPHTMYTVIVTYSLLDGTPIEAKEQCGRSYRKYEIGQMLDIEYSPEQPDFFVIRGDKSRTVAFILMFVFGLAMMAIAVAMYLKGAV